MSQAFLLSAVVFYQTLQNSLLLSIPQDGSYNSEIALNENYLYNPQRFQITKDTDALAPVIAAKAAIIMDAKTQSILYQKNAHLRLPIASITKLFTLTTVLDQNPELSKVITIDQFAADMPASKIYLKRGDKVTLYSLLQASLIASGNDATMAIVQGIFGSPATAIEKINTKVQAMGLINTRISNPVGFDDKENYSTAFEVAKLASLVQKNYPTITDITDSGPITITSELGSRYSIRPTNQLLSSFIDMRGLKTGTTNDAGESFVSLGTYQGRELITVLLNSPDRFQETKLLYTWATKHYHW
ncbi:D-alanyl-D-alanine carboxypeptidase [Candidatus Gracilibacteria bacterium]|nr:D-alanyl-D-alanine carboxypeptidase [Candidatus Gracilibacteria bacterium]